MEKEVLVFGKYHIYADEYQYILIDKPPKRGRMGSDPTFHRNLSDCLEAIYEREMKNETKGSKTLETAITRLVGFHTEFLEKLKPLRQLEGMPKACPEAAK